MDGISCDGSEQTLFHIHAHLSVFVDGQRKRIPAGVGIAHPQFTGAGNASFTSSGSCFYWLHTHAADGIIHIESPVQRTSSIRLQRCTGGRCGQPTALEEAEDDHLPRGGEVGIVNIPPSAGPAAEQDLVRPAFPSLIVMA